MITYNTILSFIKSWFWKFKFRKISYAQSGEDLIIDYIFSSILLITHPSYLDIGSFHPYYFSNTASIYLAGSRGINIEPNINNFKLFKRFRQHDHNFNIGITATGGLQDYYLMSEPPLSTFSEEIAEDLHRSGKCLIDKKLQLKTMSLSALVAEAYDGVYPDLLTIDVEGLELSILNTIDYSNANLPKVICMETVSFFSGKKRQEGIIFLKQKGYEVYADTYINTIFIRRDLFDQHELGIE